MYVTCMRKVYQGLNSTHPAAHNSRTHSSTDTIGLCFFVKMQTCVIIRQPNAHGTYCTAVAKPAPPTVVPLHHISQLDLLPTYQVL